MLTFIHFNTNNSRNLHLFSSRRIVETLLNEHLRDVYKFAQFEML